MVGYGAEGCFLRFGSIICGKKKKKPRFLYFTSLGLAYGWIYTYILGTPLTYPVLYCPTALWCSYAPTMEDTDRPTTCPGREAVQCSAVLAISHSASNSNSNSNSSPKGDPLPRPIRRQTLPTSSPE